MKIEILLFKSVEFSYELTKVTQRAIEIKKIVKVEGRVLKSEKRMLKIKILYIRTLKPVPMEERARRKRHRERERAS